MRCNYALWPAGGAAGVKNHGSALAGDFGQSGRRGCEQVVTQQPANATGSSDRRKKGLTLRVEDQRRRLRIVDEVLQFRTGGVERQWHRHAACPPDPPLHGNPRKARRHQKRDAFFPEIVAAIEQCRCHPPRRIQQLVIGEATLRIDNRCAVTALRGARDECKRAGYGPHTAECTSSAKSCPLLQVLGTSRNKDCAEWRSPCCAIAVRPDIHASLHRWIARCIRISSCSAEAGLSTGLVGAYCSSTCLAVSPLKVISTSTFWFFAFCSKRCSLCVAFAVKGTRVQVALTSTLLPPCCLNTMM